LFQYGKVISQRELDDFIRSDEFKVAVDKEIAENDAKDKSDVVYSSIEIVRKTFDASSREEKEMLNDMLIEMVSTFCQYAKHINASKMTTEINEILVGIGM
jgi:hypothetical protein